MIIVVVVFVIAVAIFALLRALSRPRLPMMNVPPRVGPGADVFVVDEPGYIQPNPMVDLAAMAATDLAIQAAADAAASQMPPPVDYGNQYDPNTGFGPQDNSGGGFDNSGGGFDNSGGGFDSSGGGFDSGGGGSGDF